MTELMNNKGLALSNAAAFVAMVVVNGLANGLPLNGRGTGEISDQYPNLFVPAGVTFSIWGLIYLLLLGLCVYGLIVAFRGRESAESVARLGPYFVLSSAANIGWIFAWHWQRIGLSVGLMLVLLSSLVFAYLRVGVGRRRDERWTRLWVHLPLSVYLGWITVATIANVTALLVDLEWSGFGLSEVTWAVVMILVAVVIGALMLFTRGDLAFALVIAWAFGGIYLERSSELTAPVPAVAWTALIGAAVLVVTGVLVRVRRGTEAERGDGGGRDGDGGGRDGDGGGRDGDGGGRDGDGGGRDGDGGPGRLTAGGEKSKQ